VAGERGREREHESEGEREAGEAQRANAGDVGEGGQGQVVAGRGRRRVVRDVDVRPLAGELDDDLEVEVVLVVSRAVDVFVVKPLGVDRRNRGRGDHGGQGETDQRGVGQPAGAAAGGGGVVPVVELRHRRSARVQ
jgi:hypothetical protein